MYICTARYVCTQRFTILPGYAYPDSGFSPPHLIFKKSAKIKCHKIKLNFFLSGMEIWELKQLKIRVVGQASVNRRRYCQDLPQVIHLYEIREKIRERLKYNNKTTLFPGRRFGPGGSERNWKNRNDTTKLPRNSHERGFNMAAGHTAWPLCGCFSVMRWTDFLLVQASRLVGKGSMGRFPGEDPVNTQEPGMSESKFRPGSHICLLQTSWWG